MRKEEGRNMIVIRCDACGEEVKEEDVNTKPKLALWIGVFVGVEKIAGHACSQACFFKVVDMMKAKAAPKFANF
jgi:hypothetical protein